MPFIGNQPADKFLTLEKQVFTTSATDTYTLDREVSSVNDIELFLNNVRQEPTEAYTISGTTLTLASAITASDSMYCIYQGRAVGTQSPATGSVTNAMLENSSITLNGSAVSLGGSDTINVKSAFTAGLASNQALSSSGKLDFVSNGTVFQTIDINSDFDNTNKRFVAPVSGIYFFQCSVYDATSSQTVNGLQLYIDGSRKQNFVFTKHTPPSAESFSGGTTFYQMSANSYAEVYADITGSLTINANTFHTYWTGHLIGAI